MTFIHHELNCFVGIDSGMQDSETERKKYETMCEDFEMITDFMDDDQDQPMNMDNQLRVILLEPLCQVDKSALKKLNDYFKLL